MSRWMCAVVVLAVLIGSVAVASAGSLMLLISSPSNGAVVTSDTVTVSGSAGCTGGAVVESVTVNGATASGTTSWSKAVSLHAGSNTITVRATDNAGGTATKTITAVYDEPTPAPTPSPTPTPSPSPTSTPTSTPTTTPTTAPTPTPTVAPTTTPTPAPVVTVLDCSPSPAHGGEDLDVRVSWANIPADWKLTVSLEKTKDDKTRLANDVSKTVSGSGEDVFKLKVYPTTETYKYAKAWACFYKGLEWKSVYGNKGIPVLPEPTTAPTIAPTATPVQTPRDTSPPAISIQSPAIIDQNNNGLLEEGEKVEITYGASDPSGVTSMEILLDGTMLESRNGAGPYTVTTNSLSMGNHTIRVVATDSKSNTGSKELQKAVERTGPSVYFGTTRTTIKKGEDAVFTLSVVNPIGNPPMTVQLILKPPSGVSVTSSSFAKGASGIYTCTQTIESGDNVRSIVMHLTGNEVGTYEIASEVYYQFEGSPKSPTRYETLTLVVDDHDSTPPTPTQSPGFAAVVAVIGLLAAYLRGRRR